MSMGTIIMQGMGILIVLVVMAQLIFVLFSSVRRTIFEKDQFDKSLQLLDHQVESAREHRALKEQERLVWNGWRKFVVERKEHECPDQGVCSFYLVAHDRRPIPPFQPGQYLTFSLKIPDRRRNAKPTIRCYSLSDSPNPAYYRVSIKKLPPPPKNPDAPPGKASNFFHDHIHEGDILDVKAPSGHFFLDMTKQTPIVLIGGGVGITPVMSMLNAVAAKGFNREVWFFYGVRHSEEHSMKRHMEQLARDSEKVHLHVCYSSPKDGDRLGVDYQHKGWVSVDLFKEVLPANNFDYYMCGPGPMMESVTTGLREWGVPDANVHFEAFGPASVKKTGKKEGKEKAVASGHKVTFSKSDQTVEWDPNVESLLELGEANDVVMDSGCRAGNCGTCIVAIKSGEVTYPIEPGYECEAGTILTCCAVPKSDVEIDA